jgi:hypothetical protein
MTTVAGLEIELPEGTPLAALVVLKYLGEAGQYLYTASCTEGLSAVEALGMAALAEIRLTDLLTEDDE